MFIIIILSTFFYSGTRFFMIIPLLGLTPRPVTIIILWKSQRIRIRGENMKRNKKICHFHRRLLFLIVLSLTVSEWMTRGERWGAGRVHHHPDPSACHSIDLFYENYYLRWWWFFLWWCFRCDPIKNWCITKDGRSRSRTRWLYTLRQKVTQLTMMHSASCSHLASSSPPFALLSALLADFSIHSVRDQITHFFDKLHDDKEE